MCLGLEKIGKHSCDKSKATQSQQNETIQMDIEAFVHPTERIAANVAGIL
jgi:hypothetical protein